MNKSQFWQLVWTPISRRLPPDIREPILIYSAVTKRWREETGFIAHEHAKKLLEGGAKDFAYDRIFTHWCEPQGPK